MRGLVATFVLSFAAPLMGETQQVGKIPRLCFLTFDPGTLQSNRFGAFFHRRQHDTGCSGREESEPARPRLRGWAGHRHQLPVHPGSRQAASGPRRRMREPEGRHPHVNSIRLPHPIDGKTVVDKRPRGATDRWRAMVAVVRHRRQHLTLRSRYRRR
jgi:hypothetical protein